MTAKHRRTAASLLVECLAAETCEYVFSVPGEETMDILEALSRQTAVRHITTRHEQGAAFMADVYGRLTGRAAVAMATLGPGATNLVTGIADAYLDHAPMVAITGQTGLDKLHKESHQYVDIVRMLEPVTKWNQRVEQPAAVPEIVRKAFRVAQLEKPGPTHIELPENLAATPVGDDLAPDRADPDLLPRADRRGDRPRRPPAGRLDPAARPGRQRRPPPERRPRPCATSPTASTCRSRARSWARARIDDRSHLSLMAVGLQARDHVLSGFDRADLVVADRLRPGRVRPVALEPGRPQADHPHRHAAGRGRRVLPARGRARRRHRRDAAPPAAGHPAARASAAASASERHATRETLVHQDLRTALLADLGAFEHDDGWPIKPQKAIADLRRALGPKDIVVSDVGAHKIWVARLYQAYEPNTVIISNGFAAMGISLPGAIAAKLVHPDRRVVALCGDGGFLMNSQELETARRIGANITVVVWRDDGYGLIDWKQRTEFGHPFGVEFSNPDFVAYAQSFGLAAFRPTRPPTSTRP